MRNILVGMAVVLCLILLPSCGGNPSGNPPGAEQDTNTQNNNTGATTVEVPAAEAAADAGDTSVGAGTGGGASCKELYPQQPRTTEYYNCRYQAIKPNTPPASRTIVATCQPKAGSNQVAITVTVNEYPQAPGDTLLCDYLEQGGGVSDVQAFATQTPGWCEMKLNNRIDGGIDSQGQQVPGLSTTHDCAMQE